MPERVQLSRKKGWRMPPNTVSVARPTKWGNPFKVGKEFNLAGTMLAFKVMLHGKMAIGAVDLTQLHGKNLACWCPLGSPCHADVLLELANRSTHP